MPDNLASCSSWLDNHPIDLHSLHPQITEQDFFQRPLPESDEDRFDIISCSLVLNFVDEPTRRGEYLDGVHSLSYRSYVAPHPSPSPPAVFVSPLPRPSPPLRPKLAIHDYGIVTRLDAMRWV